MNIFNLFLLIEDESNYENWQQEALNNQNIIATHGQNDVELIVEYNKIKNENKSLIEYCRNLKNKNDELETKVEALKKCLKEVL